MQIGIFKVGETNMKLFQATTKCDKNLEWVQKLQRKFNLNNEEAEELFTITRTCFAHNFGEKKTIHVINNYLTSLGRKESLDERDANSIFTYRAGARRYEKWSWQENVFGVLAYLLTTVLFWIDIGTYNSCISDVALTQFCGVFIILLLWLVSDKALRGNPQTTVLFCAVNRFMPGLTMIVYFLFYLFKLFFATNNVILYYYGMITVILFYMVFGIWLTVKNLKKYRKANTLAQIEKTFSE